MRLLSCFFATLLATGFPGTAALRASPCGNGPRHCEDHLSVSRMGYGAGPPGDVSKTCCRIEIERQVSQTPLFAPPGPAQLPPKTSSGSSLYHADPKHLWNRLHEALFVRIGPDDCRYGQDRLEPLLWAGSRHLLQGPSHQQAVAVLEEFVKNSGEKLVKDPLKRAVLQRDLWLVFNWIETNHHAGFRSPPTEVVHAAQAQLRPPLVATIKRLALDPKEIQNLPDNYAAAVASGEFAKGFNPKAPNQAYLPADLFDANGPWVCVGRPDGPIAPQHLDDSAVFTNSAFLLFVRLPAGRDATLSYLKKLRSFDEPLWVSAEDDRTNRVPNPKLPQFPVVTEVALVRRALLVDSEYRPVATALTESVQLRVYRQVPELPATFHALDIGGARRVQRGAPVLAILPRIPSEPVPTVRGSSRWAERRRFGRARF
jgi:hypothetical protein